MVTRTPNQQLKELVAASGLTYAAMAKAVRAVAAECGTALRTNKSTVEHWIAGVTPQGDTGRYLAVALSRRLGRLLTPADLGLAQPDEDDSIGLALGDDPIDALLPMWRFELDRRRFLTTSAYSVAAAALPLTYVQEIADRTAAARSGHTVGMAEVAAVRDMVRVFSEMDERHGGQHGRSALVQYLRDDVAPLCRGRFRTEELRQQMLSAASRGVHLLGWKSYDAGQQGLAQRYYLQSYALAVESGITGHDGFVMRTMAMQGLKLHRPEHCLGLAETGLNRAKGKVDAQTESLFRVVHAHTLAKSGQRTAALAEAERASALLTADPGDEVPFWALAWGLQPRRFTRATPRSTRRSATTAPPPSTTTAPPVPAPRAPTPASSPWTWSPAPKCSSSAVRSSKRAPPGTEPSTTWTAYGPCAPARPWPACAATSPDSAPAAYAARPNWTNAPSTSSPAPDPTGGSASTRYVITGLGPL
ncbi:MULTISPECIES: hypothetical protein [unclassified Streptomyces]|uniref:hypothetical protein n=1 Tax=unclassified Streptomyces TaxID=2593676 RepID=UPI00088243A2|nr:MULTISPECIES: hypothetical protein [unclassified Streptomyces]PBC84352.1 hypothetical protein BX261_4340 [Streptomyces sp. 2321.6]SDR31957.1 hypothetical protein SAMN05216511_2859 [Streptomyces sp. KS_16]SED28361.1 hypothetical protein SAMN05428940_4367 [Streptomyces sp. 2133.1]SEE55346.1 hypothetical protein SAMN05428954_2967 [Streptomyces sp. 2112.3]SNC70435.1 hypothetical protein SAMN06272741_4331 [Streptomyces sp. 2114.4]